MLTSRHKRKIRIRAKVSGTNDRPRIVIFKSNQRLYLQAIDDVKQITIAASSDLKSKTFVADLVDKLKALKIKKVVFDRGGYQYHGKVQEVAEELRKLGLEF